MSDLTYINESIYLKQGGAELVVASGGKITMESGGILNLESGFSFYLGSSTYSVGVTDLKNTLYGQNNVITYTAASVSVANGVLVPSVIYNKAKFHVITPGSNAVAPTLWLASAPSVGMELIILCNQSVSSGTNLGQSTAIAISCDAGAIMPMSTIVTTSRMFIHASSNSAGRVHLVCATAGVWSVVSESSATAVTF